MAASPAANSERLTSAEDSFLKVLKPNYHSFFGAPSTFASALNLATTLYHFHEWLFDGYQSQLEKRFNHAVSSKGKFWQAVEQTNPKFAISAMSRMRRSM